MARKIRFPLKMKNGAEVRTLDELKENFDLESVLGYFTDGKLATWLADRYYDEKAEAISALSADMPDLNAKLCEILEVEYQSDDDVADLEYIQRRNEKLRILSSFTDNKEILNNIDIVAMSQDELFDILDEQPEKVYLYGEKFSIPFGAKNVCYIGVNNPLVIIDKDKYTDDFDEAGISFSNVIFEEGAYQKNIVYPEPVGEFNIENGVLKKGKPDNNGVCIIPCEVTVIGNSAFWHCKELVSVTLPDNVTEIGNGAFSGCENLQTINIPDSVTSIGIDAFDGCKSIENIVLPDSITSIERGTFYKCEKLLSINIPKSVRTIGSCAFAHCEKINKIIIPDGVISIGNSAFSRCKGLKSIDMPNSMDTIEAYAFAYCSSLTSIIIPDGIKFLDNGTFCECTNLTSITIPNSVTRLGERDLFNKCNSLTNVILPNHITIDNLRYCGLGNTPWGKEHRIWG